MATQSPSEAADTAQRRERAAVAAQACQTCRYRKSKCDEQRPKCGLCQRLNAECVYREPPPTKKDKTMVHILDTLARLETKFDNLALTTSTPTTSTLANQPQSRAATGRLDPNHNRAQYPSCEAVADVAKQTENVTQGIDTSMLDHGQMDGGDTYVTPPHKIMLWPSIYIHLMNSGIQAASDLQYILQEGTRWFIKLEMAGSDFNLSPDVALPSVPLVNSTGLAIPGKVIFPSLSGPRANELTDAYFNTFNITWPILDRESFLADVASHTAQNGYGNGDAASVIALLVFALGQVAIEGVFERPIRMFEGMPSGLRGGAARVPPGLEMFNEARRRIGFISTQMTLESVQIMLLQAMYLGAASSHLEFWRSTVMASMTCQVLIKCQNIDWHSHYGGMVKRAYWTCNLAETFYHLDLDLPTSGIRHLEDVVPLPYFREGVVSDPSSAASDERSHFQYHFLAMIALRRLITRIHETVHERGSDRDELGDSSSHMHSTASHSEPGSRNHSPPVTVIREMSRQLESWRSLLPLPLQWQDSDRFDFPNVGSATRRPNESLFSPDQGHVPIGHKYNLDLMTALLRSRFYYARFMIYRPFVYKALHFPELMTPDDAECCALAIKSTILWPITMAPPKNKKRLLPDQFAWSQNFIGILLILRMTTESRCLSRICDEHVNRDDLQRTVSLLLEWVRDLSQVDAIAAWAWSILEPLYG